MKRLELHSPSRATSEDEYSDDDSSDECSEQQNDNRSTYHSSDFSLLSDYKLIGLLLLDDDAEEAEGKILVVEADVQHAPLVAGDVLTQEHISLLLQYGFLGTYNKAKIFLNTNTPFSTCICSVPGSGKSYSTSRLLKNALISSRNFRKLKNSLFALVFSYSGFNSKVIDFNIVEEN